MNIPIVPFNKNGAGKKLKKINCNLVYIYPKVGPTKDLQYFD